MYTVKPGRGPSLFAAFLAIVGGLFVLAALIAFGSGDAEAMVVVFGVWFGVVLLAVIGFALYMALARNRPSLYDVTASREERDRPSKGEMGNAGGAFCSKCGASVESDFRFCPRCGKDVRG